ncbi:MAG: FkbM family methyltransferase [Amylibacter sp.]|nr:FkbM family methyltransferase [Amylibacter sp.]
MSGIWRALTRDELTGGANHETAMFGAFAPNFVQRMMIVIGKKTVLKRGVFRGSYTWLIMCLSKGPLDILFRGCAYRIWCENNLIEYGLLLNPDYNHADLDFLLKDAPETANFVDMGSNIGLYSQPMAKVGHKGKTISIDANPLMATRLMFNAAGSRLKNLTMVSAAVSDTDGRGSLVIRKNDVAIVAVEESTDGEIPIRTLAAILDEHKIKKIHGLKIDIEGHEDKALVPFLMGAPKARLPKKIVIEHPTADADYPGCTKAFAKLNYNLVGRSRNNSFYELTP